MRAGVVWMAGGHGEMEGLAFRYEDAAYALAAGYGLVRPAENAPRTIELTRVADSLAARGERLHPGNAPRFEPAAWRPSSYHPPGYPLVLLALYKALGPPVRLWTLILQILADAAACLLVLSIGRRLVSEWAGLVAAWGTALFAPLAYLVISRIADAFAPPLFVLGFWLFLRALDTRSVARWIACGAVIGALCLMRPDFMLVPPFFALAALIVARDRRPVWRGALALFVTVALVLTPWTLRNARVLGKFTPGTTAAGMTLLQSVGQFPNPYGLGAQDDWYGKEAIRLGFEGMDDPRADENFRRRYLEILRTNPGLVARDAIRRLALGIAPPYHWGYANPHYFGHTFYDYVDRERIGPLAALRRHPMEILRAYWDRFLFVPVSFGLFLACLGCLWFARRHWRVALLVIVPYAYVVLAHLPFFMTTRMVLPGIFAQMIALGWCWELFRGRAPAPADPGA